MKNGVVSPEPSTPVKERKSIESVQNTQSVARSGTSTPTTNENKEEEVNLEVSARFILLDVGRIRPDDKYLRNVILQFLEHKEMRPNLVRVLSVILRFTPQELRRLNAKLSS